MVLNIVYVSVFLLLFCLVTVGAQAGILEVLRGTRSSKASKARGLLRTSMSMAVLNFGLFVAMGWVLGPLGFVLALVTWFVVALFTFELSVRRTLAMSAMASTVALGAIWVSQTLFLQVTEVAETVMWLA